MIVARIRDGSTAWGTGSCEIEPLYNGKKDGWFPVESFNFGFTDDKGDENKDPAPKPQPQSGNKGGGGGGGGGKGPDSKKKGDKDFAELAIEKQTDTTTAYLMLLAMEERKSKRGAVKSAGGKARDLNADIHVLGSIQLGKSAEKCIYPTIMIHLEAVNILGWDIKGSGDNRPTESVKIRYDRAAIVYCSTTDGQTFMSYGPKGWDQTSNEQFSAAKFKWWKTDDEWKKYLPDTKFRTHIP